jgi:hypothetical protein
MSDVELHYCVFGAALLVAGAIMIVSQPFSGTVFVISGILCGLLGISSSGRRGEV